MGEGDCTSYTATGKLCKGQATQVYGIFASASFIIATVARRKAHVLHREQWLV